MIRLSKFLFAAITLLFFSCGERSTLDIKEYQEFIKSEGNKLINSEKITGVNYAVTIEPPEFLFLRDNHHELNKKNDLKKLLDDYKHSIYCSLIIKDEENSLRVKKLIYSKQDYFNLVGYANTEMQKNFKLVINNEEVYCTVCHMEAPSSINPEIRIAIAFDYDPAKLYGQSSNGCEIVFEDQIFNNGIIKFAFEKEILKTWPELKI